MTAPSIAYLICSTPRSGSTLLCEALRTTGVAGCPEEFFQHRRETGLVRRPRDYFEGTASAGITEALGDGRVVEEVSLYDPRRFPTYSGYLEWTVEEGSTPNGVFGAKIMWGYFDGLIDALRHALNATGLAHEVLATAFPQLHFVLATRRDKVAQAVSLWKALQTWRWREDGDDDASDSDVDSSLEYHFEAIDHLVRSLTADEHAWRLFFESARIEPFEVVYEDFHDTPHEVALAIIDSLGIKRPRTRRTVNGSMVRQADALSSEWIARYYADQKIAGVEPVGQT